jgi:hypothetical protein
MRSAPVAAFVLGAQLGALGATDAYSRLYDRVLDATTESLTVPVEPPEIALHIAMSTQDSSGRQYRIASKC